MSANAIPPSDNPYQSPVTPVAAAPVEVTIVGTSDKDVFMWGMLCHLSSLAGFVAPFGNILGPLLVWLLKRETHTFIDKNGKESLNFQITVTIFEFVFVGLMLLLFLATESFVPMLLLIGGTWIVGLAAVIYSIVAAVAANKGQPFHYPFTIRFLR